MRMVWRDVPEAWLLLAGSAAASGAAVDEEVRAELASLSNAERSRVHVVTAFAEEEKPQLFATLDVFVMASVAESFGMAYLEAWMCRKPVIGARIGSTACVISDGIDGRLVSPDDPQGLASILVGLVRDRTARAAMGNAGFEKALVSFTWPHVVDRIERVYVRACELRAGATGLPEAVA